MSFFVFPMWVASILCSGDSGAPVHVCLAGELCGATLLPTVSGGAGPPPYSHGVGGYFGLYGTGQFDGQNSGHDFLGTVRFLCVCLSGSFLLIYVQYRVCGLCLPFFFLK